MNFIQKLIILGFLLDGSLLAMNPSTPWSPSNLEPYQLYYTDANLVNLDNSGQARHAAMKILIDENNSEQADPAKGVLSQELARSLQDESFPVVTSASLLKNLLKATRKNKPESDLKTFMNEAGFTSFRWDLYDVPQSQFILLMPKTFSILFQGRNIGLKQLPSLNALIPENAQSQNLADFPYKKLIDWLKQNKKIIPFSPKDFDQIFASKSDKTPIWDFFVYGHGALQPIIAGLTPDQFNSMLSFFDKKIKTGTIFVISCYAGGKNRTLLETTEDGVQINHNFIFILGSIADSQVVVYFGQLHANINKFLNNAGFIQDKGTGLTNLLRHLASQIWSTYTISTHGATAFPQVWLPGGYGFQTPNIIEGALTLGSVFLKKHKENNQPIIIENKIITLLYPPIIDVPLYIRPFNYKEILEKPWTGLSLVFEKDFFHNVDSQRQKEIINQLKTKGILPAYLSQLPELAQVQNDSNPNFLSVSPIYFYEHPRCKTRIHRY